MFLDYGGDKRVCCKSYISVKACIDVTLYDELFITSITEKYLLSILRIILTAVK